MTYQSPAAALAAAVAETVVARDAAVLLRASLTDRIERLRDARAQSVQHLASPLELLAFDRLTDRLTEAHKVLANYVARIDEDVRAVDPSVPGVTAPD